MEKKWQKSGQIILADPEKRTYMVATETGGVVQINRVHLQAVPDRGPRQEVESEPQQAAPPVPQPPLCRSERKIIKPAPYRDS